MTYSLNFSKSYFLLLEFFNFSILKGDTEWVKIFFEFYNSYGKNKKLKIYGQTYEHIKHMNMSRHKYVKHTIINKVVTYFETKPQKVLPGSLSQKKG